MITKRSSEPTAEQALGHSRLRLGLAAFAALALLTSACGSSSDASSGASNEVSSEESSATASEGSTPTTEVESNDTADAVEIITIDHAFGSTDLPVDPQRVVVWGWAAADASVALGVVPVAIPAHGYGGDEEGVFPWFREAIDGLGEQMPAILPDQPEVPFEAIAANNPDLILAPYSGISEEEYALLSEIAPTVAFPELAWSTDWRDVITIVGTALGRTDEATALLADIDATVAEAAAAHPEFEGKTITMVADFGGTFYVYKPADPRVGFTLDLGFLSAPAVDELANGDSSFYYVLSPERVSELTSDILVSFAADQDAADAFMSSTMGQTMSQVQDDRVVSVIGAQFVAAVSPPTALSLLWSLDSYVDLLSAGVTGEDVATPAGATDFSEDEQAVADAWSIVFDSTTDLVTKAPYLENADSLAGTIEGYAEGGAAMGGVSLVTTAVTIDGDVATLVYDAWLNGVSSYKDLPGSLALVDGQWTVLEDEFCSFMSLARTPCE